MSAYIKFSQAKRAEIQAANPGAGFGELGKLVGAEWQKLSPAEKASYGAAGKTTKTRKTRSNKGGHHMRKTKEMHNGLPVYTNANLAKSNNNSNNSSNSSNSNKKNNKNTTKKARRANPYANFVKAHWAEAKAKNPGGSLADVSKQIAAMWKAQK
jgi:hypothetical protein